MKLLFSLLLMSTVLYSELSSIIHVCSIEVGHIDSSMEGEAEKDTKENKEDSSKIKIRQKMNFADELSIGSNNDLLSKWSIATPYLEIHSPPPELF